MLVPLGVLDWTAMCEEIEACGWRRPRRTAMLGKHLAGRQPSGSSVGAVLGPRIESNRGTRRRPVHRVYDRLEQRKALGRQADTSADYDAVAARDAK